MIEIPEATNELNYMQRKTKNIQLSMHSFSNSKIQFSWNIRVYYVNFIYSCMRVNVKYDTKFQYMYIDTTIFTF